MSISPVDLSIAVSYAKSSDLADWYLCDGIAEINSLGLWMIKRVKTWRATCAVLVEIGHLDDDGHPVVDSSYTDDYNMTSDSPDNVDREEDLAFYHDLHWSGGTDDTEVGNNGKFDLRCQLRATEDDTQWYLSFGITFSTDYGPIPGDGSQAHYQCNGSAGTDDENEALNTPDQIQENLLSFAEQEWSGIPQKKAAGPNTDDGKYKSLTFMSCSLTPLEYWSYGGAYDTETGAPSDD